MKRADSASTPTQPTEEATSQATESVQPIIPTEQAQPVGGGNTSSSTTVLPPEPIQESGPNIWLIVGIVIAVIVLVVIIIVAIVASGSKKKTQPVMSPSPMPMPSPSPMATPTPVPQPAPSPARPPMPTPPSFDTGAGETSVLGVGAGETSVLGGGSSQPPATLIRKKNGESISITKPSFSIGKERSKVDFCVPDNNSVSRSHANIVCKGGVYYIIDNNSTNFTFVNGNKISPRQEVKLNSGDKIKLADEEFEFRQ